MEFIRYPVQWIRRIYMQFIYGYREKNINKVRWLLSQEKHAKENLVINLTVLPPCLNVLRIYSERANFVIKVWKSSLKKKLMKRVSQITAGMNMVIFGGLTNHFLMILVEYFSIIYTITNNMILEAIMKKERIKMKITSYLVTLDLVLNTGSDIYLNQLFFITTYKGVIQKLRNAKKHQFYPPPPHCNGLSHFLWYPPH